MSTIIFQKLDGTIFDLDQLGFRVKKFDVPTTNYNYTYQQIGQYGAKLTAVQAQQLVIPLTLNILAIDSNDLFLQRLKLNRMLQSHEEFYVYDTSNKAIRWKVHAEATSVSRDNSFWRASNVQINLDCPTGYAESSYTTQEIDSSTPKGVAFGMGLNSKEHQYTFTNQSNIDFYNAGVIKLTAEEHPVTIEFQGTAPNGITISNQTTNQSFQYKNALNSSDTLKIQGVMPIINGIQNYDAGNHGFLDFETGTNRISITGASNFKVKFDTRFYY